MLDKYTIVEADRTLKVYNWLQYFDPEELERELTECKLRVEDFYSYVTGSPYNPKGNEFAVVAQKM